MTRAEQIRAQRTAGSLDQGYQLSAPQQQNYGLTVQGIIDAIANPGKGGIYFPIDIRFTPETKTIIYTAVGALAVGLIVNGVLNYKSR